MNDYSKSTLPRESPLGREVDFDSNPLQRNRALIFAGAGILVLCGVLCLALALLWSLSSGGQLAGLSLPSLSSATATPTKSPKPTPVPYGKTTKDDSGLRVSATYYQRPLPVQDFKIPKGQELVLVTVKIDNTRVSGGPLPYSSDDFKLVSPDGDSFAADNGSITTNAEDMLRKGEVAPGKSAKGDIIFYVYSDVKELQLAWTSADGETRLFALKK